MQKIFFSPQNILAFLCLVFYPLTAPSAPGAKLDSFWNKFNDGNKQQICHKSWQIILDRGVVKDNRLKQNLFSYTTLSSKERSLLRNYLEYLQSIDPRVFSRAEQKAYWINLYNALTVKLVLENYPVESITEIKQRFYHFGHWNKKLAIVQGRHLSLNDIEHRILRPIWKDPLIHYGVNCASIGCPDLSSIVFTGENVDRLLEQAAKKYINHSRGLLIERGQLILSSIYEWYEEDFGGGREGVFKHLMEYANPEKRSILENYQGKVLYHYNWSLNDRKLLVK